MIQVVEPDYYIKIGIKDNNVVLVDWEGMIRIDEYLILSNKKIKYLKQAIKFIQRK